MIGSPSRAVALIAVGAAGAGAAVAVGAVSDSNGVIHACVLTVNGEPITSAGNIRIIDPNATPPQTCNTGGPGAAGSEEPLSWNTVGPQGATGPQGPAGPTGAQGVEGHTLTISGQSFSLGNGKAVTVTGQGLVAPLAPNTRGRPVGTLSFTGGTAPGSFGIYSWSFGATQAGAQSSGRGTGAGSTGVREIQITKTVDKASPSLFKACANGQHFKTATLTVRKAGASQPYLTITLSNPVISSYQQADTKGDTKPTESLSLNFTKIEYTYQTQK